jgi:DNA helicase-2/ATP-dependent DNA helicase PcrA
MQPVLPVKAESLQAGLNPEQAAAVVHTSGPLLILAGAGTGKTRVITHRIASLVMRGLAAPREVLALTFTNKAAAEMRDRTQVLIGHDAKFATISTFHSACARWLREYARYAELKPSFSIYDDEDQLSLVRVVAEAMNIPHDAAAARSYRQRIEQANNEAMRTVEVQSRARGRDGELFAELYTAYQAALIQANAVDFGSLVSTMVHLLEDNEEIRSQFRRRYRHVLVDEFQDTNRAQYRLLRQLAGDDSQIAAVGDDDQSIYRWRGATVENVRAFQSDYACTTIALEQNYRSTRPILDAAHTVVKHLSERLDKRLRTDRQDAEAVRVCILSDDREEADFVARSISRIRRERNLAWNDFAVFYRTNAQSRMFEERLRAEGVPYEVVGGTGFFERREIRDVLAYLRLTVNPTDDIAFRRVVNVPSRGVGTGTLRQIEVFAADHAHGSLRTALAEYVKAPLGKLPKKTRESLQRFHALLSTFAEAALHADAAQFIDMVLSETSYLTWLDETEPDTADDRRANVDELRNAARDYCDRAEDKSLIGFLEYSALRGSPEEQQSDGTTVSLMTVHGSKGLEFPVVFATGLEDETFPLQRRQALTPEESDEERRLCYVAFTRARDLLTITACTRRRMHGQTRYTRPSAFLLNLSDEPVILLPESISIRIDWQGGGGGSGGGSASIGGTGPRLPAQRPGFDEFDQRPWQERAATAGGSQIVGEIPEAGIIFDDSHFPEASLQKARGYVGRRARHTIFGIGKVVDADPTGEHIRLTIDFPGAGIKKVVLKYVDLLD